MDGDGRNLPTDRTLKHVHRSKNNKHARVVVNAYESGFCDVDSMNDSPQKSLHVLVHPTCNFLEHLKPRVGETGVPRTWQPGFRNVGEIVQAYRTKRSPCDAHRQVHIPQFSRDADDQTERCHSLGGYDTKTSGLLKLDPDAQV